MHVVHADEFILDLALIFPELGTPLGTVWVSAMIDSYTRTVLGVIVSFESPGYVTTMMLLRECLKGWGRLPEILFMDNGPGYKNISLVLFAKYYHIQLCWRPPGRPRWGAEIEKFGGDINHRVAGELPGATKLLNKFRRISKSHHPDTLAIFGLQTVAEILRDWCYTFHDTLPHGGLHGKTPHAMREISLSEHGVRSHLKISDDPLFEIISLPAPEGDGTAKVQAHDGVQVDNLYYWHEKFHYPDIVGKYVDVRWDPFDITKVYAFVSDEWVECTCLKLRKLRRLSKEDLCAASLEIRKGRSDYNKSRDSILERVAAFLDTKRKTGEALAHLLRTKGSAQQFLARMQPPRLDDDEPTASAEGVPAPRPRIPGFPGNVAALT
jgi:putative transposase